MKAKQTKWARLYWFQSRKKRSNGIRSKISFRIISCFSYVNWLPVRLINLIQIFLSVRPFALYLISRVFLIYYFFFFSHSILPINNKSNKPFYWLKQLFNKNILKSITIFSKPVTPINKTHKKLICEMKRSKEKSHFPCSFFGVQSR